MKSLEMSWTRTREVKASCAKVFGITQVYHESFYD